MIKPKITLYILILLCAPHSYANNAADLMSALGFNELLPSLVGSIRNSEMIDAPQIKEAEAKIQLQKVIDEIEGQFKEHFSDNELKVLANFYAADIGKASARNDQEEMLRIYEGDPEQKKLADEILNSHAFKKIPIKIPMISAHLGEFIAKEYVNIFSEAMENNTGLQDELKQHCLNFYQAGRGFDAYITCIPASELDCPACKKAAGILESMYPEIVHRM